mgnify:CR=1 FL=1
MLDLVSIHAPAWGATCRAVGFIAFFLVSIHAPAWGATLYGIKNLNDIILFQSTRPHGARLSVARGKGRAVSVSIHAPAWGATPDDTFRYLEVKGFNPRARMGRDGRPSKW